MPLSAVIVDDEQLARDELAFLLKSAGDVNVVAQGKNGLEASTSLKNTIPIWFFSTSKCRDWTGFGVIKKLSTRENPSSQNCLRYAFDQYAGKGF